MSRISWKEEYKKCAKERDYYKKKYEYEKETVALIKEHLQLFVGVIETAERKSDKITLSEDD